MYDVGDTGERMSKILMSQIRLDGDTQPRTTLDQDRVQHYASCMDEGDEFPPVTVFHDGSSYWLSSGFHRYHAYRTLGYIEVEAEVIVGTQNEAQLHAIADNAKHGLSLTAEDVRNNVRRMLEHPLSKGWADRKIARHIGTSPMTVGRVRKSLEPQTEEPKVRTTERAGKVVQVETTKVGRKPVQPEEPDTKVLELSDAVTVLHEENQRLRDAVALGQWDATDIEKIDAEETIQELRERIRVLEQDNQALRDSRDMYQNRNAELMATVKSLQAKLKKLDK